MRLQKLHVFAECGRLCVPIPPGDDAGAKSRSPFAWNLNHLAGYVPCLRPRACCCQAATGPPSQTAGNCGQIHRQEVVELTVNVLEKIQK